MVFWFETVVIKEWRTAYADLLLTHALNIPEGGLLGLVGGDRQFREIIETLAGQRSIEVVVFTPQTTAEEVAHFSERDGYLLRLLGRVIKLNFELKFADFEASFGIENGKS